MAENFGTAMRGMFLPQYDYLARKQAAMQVAQAELQSLLGRYENQVEAQARKSRSSAVDQLARYGQLTSTTAARAFGEIEAGKAADLNAAYGNIEQERANARARMAEVQQMKGAAKAQDIGNLVKTGVGIGLGIAGGPVGGAIGKGMQVVGQGLTGLPFAAGQGAEAAYAQTKTDPNNPAGLQTTAVQPTAQRFPLAPDQMFGPSRSELIPQYQPLTPEENEWWRTGMYRPVRYPVMGVH